MGKDAMTAQALSVEHVRAPRSVKLRIDALNVPLCALAAVLLGLLPTAAQSQGNQQQAPLLATPGQHGVTDSGAATYSIPLRLPPGAAGMEPRLSLQYSSHSGNGSLGLGWSIGGLSAITRCPRTMASDNARGTVLYDSNDRFCLDGQRLIAIAGGYGAANTEYRLERDPFTRVIGRHSAQTNASYFEVSRRNGELSLYGASTDSRIEAQGKSIPIVWTLYRQIDVNQNYLEWTYVEDNPNGAWYPARVDYTGKLPGGAGSSTYPTHARVQFILEARPAADQVTKYHAGSGQRQTLRIKQIKTYTNQNYTSAILDYRLTYDASPATGYSRVTQIQECTGAGVCLPGTAVTWGAAGASLAYTFQAFSYGDDVNWSENYDPPPEDFNGDGLADSWEQVPTTIHTGDGAVLRDKLSISLKSGSEMVPGWENSGVSFASRVDYGGTTDDETGKYTPDYRNYRGKGYRFKDIDGDGRTDILNLNTQKVEFWRSTGSSFERLWSADSWQVNDYFESSSSSWYTSPGHKTHFGDFDGDGITDVLFITIDGYIKIYRWNGSGFSISGPSGNPCVYYMHERGDDADTEYTFTSIYPDLRFGVHDANGDGKDDLVFSGIVGNRFVQRGWISTGTGWLDFEKSLDFQIPHALRAILSKDLNQDRMADVLILDEQGNLNVWISLGMSYVHRGVTNIGSLPVRDPDTGDLDDNEYSLTDVDGDGRAEFIVTTPEPNVVRTERRLAIPVDVDRVAQIDNGLGGQYKFEYATLSQEGGAGLYDKGVLPTYPKQAVQAPYAVVKRSIIAGAGTDSATHYSYSGLQFELGTGRGLLGFATVTRAQPQAGRTTVTTFHQDYPLTGLTQSVVTTAANSSGSYVQVKRIDNTQHCRAVATGSPASSFGNCSLAPGRLYYSYLQQSTEQGWDLNGAALPWISTTNTYDCAVAATCWGNLHSSKVSTSDGFSKTSSFTYRNDLNRWHFGLPLNTTVQSNAPAWSGLESLPMAPPMAGPDPTPQPAASNACLANPAMCLAPILSLLLGD